MLHPAAIGAITLLVLNDHLLKEAVPSWLTGKLSDFAGLFFFPFLVSVVLALLLSLWPRTSPTAVGRASFVITALWFASAKATSLGNSLTADAVSGLLGYPVSIVLDPTDLVALVVLWPAWRLWRQEAFAVRSGRVAGRAAWLVLIVAAIASMGTSPMPQEVVLRFAVADDEFYALTKYAPFYFLPESKDWRVFRTPDGGVSWERVDPVPEAIKDRTIQLWSLGTTAADANLPGSLYRVKAEGRVEFSSDGGSTWDTIWKVPDGRQELLGRYYGGLEPMIGPYDLAFFPDGSGTLVVALGTEGVLIRNSSGEWSRYAVGQAKPTPFSSFDPGQAFRLMLFPEGLLIIAGALLAFCFVSVGAWIPGLKRIRRVSGVLKVWRILRPEANCILLAAGIALAFGLLYKAAMESRSFSESLVLSGYTFLFLSPVVAFGCLSTWANLMEVIRDADQKASLWRSLRVCSCIAVGLLVTASLPFYLWVAGVVSWYSSAVWMAFACALAIAIAGGILVYRLERTAIGRAGSIGEQDRDA